MDDFPISVTLPDVRDPDRMSSNTLATITEEVSLRQGSGTISHTMIEFTGFSNAGTGNMTQDTIQVTIEQLDRVIAVARHVAFERRKLEYLRMNPSKRYRQDQ